MGTDVWGAVVERYRYDSYGNRTIFEADDSTVRTASSYGNQRGFTGYYADAESGLYYARARMYSPTLGRYIGRDPLEYIDGMSLYNGYLVPSLVDPSGFSAFTNFIELAIEKCEENKKAGITGNGIDCVKWAICQYQALHLKYETFTEAQSLQFQLDEANYGFVLGVTGTLMASPPIQFESGVTGVFNGTNIVGTPQTKLETATNLVQPLTWIPFLAEARITPMPAIQNTYFEFRTNGNGVNLAESL